MSPKNKSKHSAYTLIKSNFIVDDGTHFIIALHHLRHCIPCPRYTAIFSTPGIKFVFTYHIMILFHFRKPFFTITL